MIFWEAGVDCICLKYIMGQNYLVFRDTTVYLLVNSRLFDFYHISFWDKGKMIQTINFNREIRIILVY